MSSKSYRQNTSYQEILSGEQSENTADASNNAGRGNHYSLPYGLCKSEGIDTTGMTPRDAWSAWMSKTGKTKEQAEAEHWKTGEENKTGQKTLPQLQNEAIRYLREKGIDRYARIDYKPKPIVNIKYSQMQDSLISGNPLTTTFSKETASALLEKIEYERISNAKRILKSDRDDEKSARGYEERNRQLDKMEDYVKNLLNNRKSVPTPEELEKQKAIEYFKKRQAEKRAKLEAGENVDREITSTTYERAQKRLLKSFNSWFGRGM